MSAGKEMEIKTPPVNQMSLSHRSLTFGGLKVVYLQASHTSSGRGRKQVLCEIIWSF